MSQRKVILAFGYQIRDLVGHKDVVDHLNSEATSTGPDKWKFKKKSVEVDVELVYTKDAFRAALDDEGAIVVYDGHSRIGQGPAFGDAASKECPDAVPGKINPWSDHFRMGYDAVHIECIDEIMHHCTDPIEPSGTMPKDFFAKSGVKAMLATKLTSKCKQKGYAKRALLTCFPDEAVKVNGRGDQTLKSRHYWYTASSDKEFITVVTVGSKDLDAVSLKCSILFMNSCSSLRHYLEALRRRKAKVKSRCMFYLTAESCSSSTSVIFLRAILEGFDVASKKGRDTVLDRMNGEDDAGRIWLYR